MDVCPSPPASLHQYQCLLPSVTEGVSIWQADGECSPSQVQSRRQVLPTEIYTEETLRTSAHTTAKTSRVNCSITKGFGDMTRSRQRHPLNVPPLDASISSKILILVLDDYQCVMSNLSGDVL